HEPVRRGPVGQERPHRRGRRMAAEDDPRATVAVGDGGDIGYALQHRSLREFWNVSVSTHVSDVYGMSKTLIGSVVQQILRLLYIGTEFLLRTTLEGSTCLDPPIQEHIGVHARTLASISCSKAMICRSCEDERRRNEGNPGFEINIVPMNGYCV